MRPPASIDFTRSLPPVPPGLGAALSQALHAVANGDLAEHTRSSSAAGRDIDRAVGAAWLAPRFGAAPDPARLLVANSTQSAVLLLLGALVPAGKRLVAEGLSYGVLADLCRVAGVAVEGLAIDAEGLDPRALATAAASGGVAAVYLNPTFHNPTAAVMGPVRRAEIAAVARRYDLAIIEDDPLGLLDPALPAPVAAHAPERSWYVATLTKTIAQGMRVAYLLAPTPLDSKRLLAPVARLSHWVAAPLMLGAATWLIETGHAREICHAIADENRRRDTLARSILPEGTVEGAPGSPHIWLPLAETRAGAIAAELEREGVLVRCHEKFRIAGEVATPSGLRLSLSSVPDTESLEAGLRRIARRLL